MSKLTVFTLGELLLLAERVLVDKTDSTFHTFPAGTASVLETRTIRLNCKVPWAESPVTRRKNKTKGYNMYLWFMVFYFV